MCDQHEVPNIKPLEKSGGKQHWIKWEPRGRINLEKEGQHSESRGEQPRTSTVKKKKKRTSTVMH